MLEYWQGLVTPYSVSPKTPFVQAVAPLKTPLAYMPLASYRTARVPVKVQFAPSVAQSVHVSTTGAGALKGGRQQPVCTAAAV